MAEKQKRMGGENHFETECGAFVDNLKVKVGKEGN